MSFVEGILGFVSGLLGFGRISSSRPYAWFRPHFVPPSPFLVVKDPHSQSSRILVEPHLIDAEFRNAWMPYFCRSGHPVVSPEQFLGFIGHFCLRNLCLIFLGSRVGTCKRWLGLRSLQQVGWMGGLGTSPRHFPYPGSLVWLFFWSWLRPLESGHKVFLDAYIAMIPTADGDSTHPLGQRPLSVLPVVYRLWASLRLGHLREWVEGWLPKSVFGLGNGLSSVEAWFSTALDIEEVLSGTGGDQLQSFDTVDRSILDCALGRLG